VLQYAVLQYAVLQHAVSQHAVSQHAVSQYTAKFSRRCRSGRTPSATERETAVLVEGCRRSVTHEHAHTHKHTQAERALTHAPPLP
jgi:hypothetical protein